jgi:hypothetical protein
MNLNLRPMIIAVGTVLLAGVGFRLYTPQPATRSMAELRDAGITDGQRIVVVCPERVTKQTKRRINAVQPGVLRPGQSYAHVARTARCWNPDGGNCFRPADWAPRVDAGEAEIIIPSLRRNLSGVDLDASVGADDGGDSDDVDDAFQFRLDDCTTESCATFDAGSVFQNPFCANLNRLMVVPSPCMLPNGWGRAPDGGWDESGQVDCLCGGPYGLSDGGARWRGFNVCPTQYASGTACVPVECSVSAGDVPEEWL